MCIVASPASQMNQQQVHEMLTFLGANLSRAAALSLTLHEVI